MIRYRVQSGDMNLVVLAAKPETAARKALTIFSRRQSDGLLGLLTEVAPTKNATDDTTFYISTKTLLQKLNRWAE